MAERKKCSSCKCVVEGLTSKVCDQCLIKQRQKMQCPCGRMYRRGNKSRHVKTSIHAKRLIRPVALVSAG